MTFTLHYNIAVYILYTVAIHLQKTKMLIYTFETVSQV